MSSPWFAMTWECTIQRFNCRRGPTARDSSIRECARADRAYRLFLFTCPRVLIDTMKTRVVLALSSLFLISSEAPAQIKLPGIFKKIPTAGISEKEAGQGVKEALSQGVGNAILNLHKTDGFFGSSLYKVLLPPD